MPLAKKKKRTPVGEFFYGLRYRAGEYAVKSFVGSLPWLPDRLLILITNFWAWLTFVLLWKYRVRMEANVLLVFGEDGASAADRKALVWRAWKNFALGVLDTSAVMHYSREKIIATVSITGEEHLKRALEKRRGVLALSAHLGSFAMIGARLAAAGYPFSVVVKQPADERFAKLIDRYRAQIGIHTISAKPRREAVRGIIRALRENRVVLMIADEFKSGDVMVDFMGRKAPAPRGPATLALRTGAVTLPMFATRRSDGSLVLTIDEPIEPVEREELESSVVATTAIYTRHIESAIRRHPDQWNWLGLPQDGKISRAQMARQLSPAQKRRRIQKVAH